MYCLKNLEYARLPNDIIKLYTDLYPFVGRNQMMLKTVSKDIDTLIAQTVRLDAYYFAVLFDAELSESRFRAIITKDVQAKNKTERFVRNIKQAFIKIHEETESFNLSSTEIFDMIQFLYREVEPVSQVQFAKTEKKRDKTTDLLSSAHPTKREALEQLIASFSEARKHSDFEIAFLAVNFYIDFINLRPFVKHNKALGLMLLYILLLDSNFKSLHLASFFELLYKQNTKLEKLTKDASHNWGEGLADVMGLHRFILQRLLESYQSLHELLRNYTFDQQTNKSDYIENTINKLDEVFTKEEIRALHPTISDSTINRTLKRLRDEKKIRPLGKGRSAKWMKLYQTQKKPSIYEQIKFKV